MCAGVARVTGSALFGKRGHHQVWRFGWVHHDTRFGADSENILGSYNPIVIKISFNDLFPASLEGEVITVTGEKSRNAP